MTTFSLMKSLFFVISCVLIAACSGKTETANGSAEKIATSEEINDMSIYQLTSSWQTQDGDEMTWSDLEGEVLVTVMIYTSCKAACPRLVADMRALEEKVGKTSAPVRYILVSIDPETDTPERLKEFARLNKMDGDQWLFLRSTEDNTREFANVMAVKYARISPLDFSHSNIISVFDRRGAMVHQMEGLAVNNDQTIEAILIASR